MSSDDSVIYFNRVTLNSLSQILEVKEFDILENIRHGQLSHQLPHLSTKNLRVRGLSRSEYDVVLRYYARVKGNKKAINELNHDIFKPL